MGSQNRAHLSSNSKMVHIGSPSGLHVQSTDPCKIVSQSPSGLVLPWRKINFLTVLEAKSKIEEPANSAPVKTDSLPGLQTATFSPCPCLVFPLCLHIPDVYLCVQVSSSCRDTNQIAIGPISLTPFNFNYSLKCPNFLYYHILRLWGLEL